MFLIKEYKYLNSKNFIIYFKIYYKFKILFFLKNYFFCKKINKKKVKKIFLLNFKKNKYFHFFKMKIFKNNKKKKIEIIDNLNLEVFFINKKMLSIIF